MAKARSKQAAATPVTRSDTTRERKRAIGIRISKGVAEQLAEAAKASGNSIAREIEARLQRSYDADVADRAFADVGTTQLLRDISLGLLLVERAAGASAAADPRANRLARFVVERLVARRAPASGRSIRGALQAGEEDRVFVEETGAQIIDLIRREPGTMFALRDEIEAS